MLRILRGNASSKGRFTRRKKPARHTSSTPAVDTRFTAMVKEGDFDQLAAEALKELKEGKSIPLHEVLDERHIP